MTNPSFQSYNAIPDFFQTKLSPIFFYISKDKISKQTKEKKSHWQDSELGQSNPYLYVKALNDQPFFSII
jgi:hypothetical protein